jgi:nitrite reductase/ring-hydroxylating ferredoxin subunit
VSRVILTGAADAIPNHFVVPYYLDDRKQRIAIARVNDRLYAFDDLCTCSGQSCPLSGGLLKDMTIMCQCHGSRFNITTAVVLIGRRPRDSMSTRCKKLKEVFESDSRSRSILRSESLSFSRANGGLCETIIHNPARPTRLAGNFL